MGVRTAERTDVPLIINLLLRMRDESPTYSDVPADVDYIEKSLLARFDYNAFVGVVDEAGGGCMIGVVGPQWYSPTPQAFELMLYALPERRGTGLAVRLVRGFEAVCRAKGAQYLHVGTSTGIREQRTTSMYGRLGYSQHGGGLRKAL